jgi:hypothetical protein
MTETKPTVPRETNFGNSADDLDAAELANRGPRETSVIVYLTVREADALAQFVKRVGWHELAANAIDRDEAELIRDAIARLQRALADSGFNPR